MIVKKFSDSDVSIVFSSLVISKITLVEHSTYGPRKPKASCVSGKTKLNPLEFDLGLETISAIHSSGI